MAFTVRTNQISHLKYVLVICLWYLIYVLMWGRSDKYLIPMFVLTFHRHIRCIGNCDGILFGAPQKHTFRFNLIFLLFLPNKKYLFIFGNTLICILSRPRQPFNVKFTIPNMQTSHSECRQFFHLSHAMKMRCKWFRSKLFDCIAGRKLGEKSANLRIWSSVATVIECWSWLGILNPFHCCKIWDVARLLQHFLEPNVRAGYTLFML